MEMKECFEKLVRNKANRMAYAASWKEQAAALGIKSDAELRAFKLGSWDAMIFDMAQALNLGRTCGNRDSRKRLIQQWLNENL